MSELDDPPPSSRPRVVLIAHDVGGSGGMEQAMYELVAGACDRVDFTVVSASLVDELRPMVVWRRVPTLRRPFAVKFIVFFLLAGFRYRRHDAVVVHSLGAIVPRRVDVMAIHFCHAAYQADTKELGLEVGQSLLRRVNRAVAFRIGLFAERLFTRPPWARSVTAVSAGGAREIARFYPAVDVTVIANGIDHERFQPKPAVRDDMRAQAATGPADVVVLFVGGRWSQKGLEVAINGLAVAQRLTTERLVLWIAGSGDVRHYQRIATGLGVGDRVRFVGYVPNTERLYQAADIFVLPSAYETFCLVAYEAASSELPVVATMVNGVDDLLSDGLAGIPVDASPDSVGRALADLANHPDRRRAMGVAGRRRAMDKTWAEAANRTVAMYQGLTHRVVRREGE